jgi:hypothetical protein
MAKRDIVDGKARDTSPAQDWGASSIKKHGARLKQSSAMARRERPTYGHLRARAIRSAWVIPTICKAPATATTHRIIGCGVIAQRISRTSTPATKASDDRS